VIPCGYDLWAIVDHRVPFEFNGGPATTVHKILGLGVALEVAVTGLLLLRWCRILFSPPVERGDAREEK